MKNKDRGRHENSPPSGDRLQENSRDQDIIPKHSSRLEISILNLAHGEEVSNYDQNPIQMDDEQARNIDPNNINETGDLNVKFKKVKDHGLKCPLHPQQIMTWVVMFVLVLTFYALLVPGTYFIGTAFSIIISLLYLGLLIAVGF